MKTLIFDIETAPSIAYVWGAWKQNIGLDMDIEPEGYIMSLSYKWLGNDTLYYIESRTDDDKELLLMFRDVLDEADFVVAHNGKKFDIPMINTRLAIHSIHPPAPYKVIDTLQIAKKEMRFRRNSLAHLAEVLDCKHKKLSHSKFPGFKLWDECLKDNDEAWAEMRLYNEYDVIVLEEVYKKLRPFASNHPNVTTGDDPTSLACPKCGSNHVRKRGFFTTNKGKYQRYSCDSCGGWSSETYMVNTRENRKNLLASR
jgi:predicted RNA-binding Zn-ribbon protein involved in translation (DUF1610 family)/rRNA-processing protein FCF1